MTEYAVISQIIREQGLLERSRLYYLINFLFIGGLYSVIIGLLLNIPLNALFVIIISIIWTFTSVQIGAMGHDANHYQVFSSKKYNDWTAYLCWNIGLGISNRWWQDQHNEHHFHPNDIDKDPSINLQLMSFSKEQFGRKRAYQKLFIRYQAYLYFPLMAFGVISLRISSILFILKNKRDKSIVELAGILLHLSLYSVFIFSILGLKYGLFFVILHHILQGLYIGVIFAPNHKGMPIIKSGSKIDPIFQQIITSRNIKDGPVTSLLFGGLNYQIEHHLFTNMPRNNLKRAKPTVEKFCQER